MTPGEIAVVAPGDVAPTLDEGSPAPGEDITAVVDTPTPGGNAPALADGSPAVVHTPAAGDKDPVTSSDEGPEMSMLR